MDGSIVNKPEWNETCSQAPANKEFSAAMPKRRTPVDPKENRPLDLCPRCGSENNPNLDQLCRRCKMAMNIENLPNDVRRRIVDLHQTYGVNHVIFLLDYKYNADVVNQVLREEISRLKSENGVLKTKLSDSVQISELSERDEEMRRIGALEELGRLLSAALPVSEDGMMGVVYTGVLRHRIDTLRRLK